MPKVSVIIPVYKVEKYLPDCLNSVLSQTFTDWEAICVDDGSPDKCGAILKTYAEKDNRIKVVTQENQGVSVARNQALQQAKGDYICFVDSDDTLAPTFLERLYDLLQTTGSDIASCDFQSFPPNKDVHHSAGVKTTRAPFDDFIQQRLLIPVAIWAKLYKKSVFNQLHFDAQISQGGEDLLYLYQALYQAHKVVHTHQPFYFYRKRPSSVTTSNLSQRYVLGNIKTAELLNEYFKDKELSSKTRKILNQKIAKRIFKFGVLEPKRKDKDNLDKWYALTRPLLKELKAKGIYQPQYLSFKNRFKSWHFLKGKI